MTKYILYVVWFVNALAGLYYTIVDKPISVNSLFTFMTVSTGLIIYEFRDIRKE